MIAARQVGDPTLRERKKKWPQPCHLPSLVGLRSAYHLHSAGSTHELWLSFALCGVLLVVTPSQQPCSPRRALPRCPPCGYSHHMRCSRQLASGLCLYGGTSGYCSHSPLAVASHVARLTFANPPLAVLTAALLAYCPSSGNDCPHFDALPRPMTRGLVCYVSPTVVQLS